MVLTFSFVHLPLTKCHIIVMNGFFFTSFNRLLIQSVRFKIITLWSSCNHEWVFLKKHVMGKKTMK